MSNQYEVAVSNIGTVHAGKNYRKARKIYLEYMKLSQGKVGRAGGEEVTLFKNGEILNSYVRTEEE